MKISFPKIIYWIANFLFALSIGFLLYLFFGLICYVVESLGWKDFDFIDILDDPDKVSINIPITDFTISFPSRSFEILFMILFFAFYALYFYLMRNFFGIFHNVKLFSKQNLQIANRFIFINFLPIAFWLVLAIYYAATDKNVNFFDEDFLALLIHVFVIIIALLYRDMLKKGILLQEEADLTI